MRYFRNYNIKRGYSSYKTGRTDSRLKIIRGIFIALGFVVILRLFTLQVLGGATYQLLASDQREIYRKLFPERGEILMREGKGGGLTALATNKDLYLVYADPRMISDPVGTARNLAPLLEIEENAECIIPNHPATAGGTGQVQNAECKEGEDQKNNEYEVLLERLSKRGDPYEPLKHGIEEAVVNQIKELHLAGIDTVRESVRYYPNKEVGAQVAGFVGAQDDKLAGRYGIEGYFNHELAGTPGFFEGERDVGGRWIPVSRRELQPAQDGSTIVLTIDRAIEYVACNKLDETVRKYNAASGSVVIMKIPEGKILAMCNYPSFNSNDYRSVEDISVFNNPIISAQYEPGSVFKVITMAAALDSGEVTPETTYTDAGEIKIGPYKINNSDNKAHGVQTMTQVLEESLNTGAIFAAKKVGINRFQDYIERFGFGVKTGIQLDAEVSGDISALSKRGEIYLATASFGQGIAVTPLQLIAAFAAIANQGKLVRPYIVEEIRKNTGAILQFEPEIIREAISAQAATLLKGMMTSVVERGHGKRAGVPGYYVAGKTGTAQIPRRDGPGYEPGATIGTFAGFAPVEDPRFVMLTRIDRPHGVQFAESTAAPLFGEIAKFLLQYFEVKPTRPIKP